MMANLDPPDALHWRQASCLKRTETMTTKQQHGERDQAQDRAVEDTFPASDPPANSGITGAEVPAEPSDERDVEAQPTGTPTSDRHATETAHHWEPEVKPTDKGGKDT
ncbi:hypothetical protein [Rhodopila sp.]|uniref:hypothetical protein n=1 Tax=Rhodopila sp. TaxID=2480087 RepID=UPI003D1367B8